MQDLNPRKYIGQVLTIIIDRPLGSTHPKHGFEYPVNYGYLPGIFSGDSEELDAYILGVDKPLDTFIGVCIAVIHRLDDDDDKLIIVPKGATLSDKEIRSLTHFQEQWFTNEIWR
ncbi:MAG: inorganic diphosphatase [Anaerolineae bacterium]|nr:inorganic diphosphatase [Anaerolineae bacterium]